MSLIIVLLAEFDFDRLCLSKSEVIFYFYRLTLPGMFYVLLQDFKNGISPMEYSLLPLRRPSSSNEGVRLDMTAQREARNNHQSSRIGRLLQRPGDYASGEVLARDGNPIAAAPGPNVSSESIIPGAPTNKRKCPGSVDDDRAALLAMTVPNLKKLVKDGNFRLARGGPRNKRKKDIVDAIVDSTSYGNH